MATQIPRWRLHLLECKAAAASLRRIWVCVAIGAHRSLPEKEMCSMGRMIFFLWPSWNVLSTHYASQNWQDLLKQNLKIITRGKKKYIRLSEDQGLPKSSDIS